MPAGSKVTNFPGGVASFGVPILPQRYYRKTLWVGNASGLQVGDGSSPEYPLSSILTALSGAHSTMGTLIHVLPNHVQSVDAADWATATGTKTGITIRGHGDIGTRPTLHWSTATSTWLFDTNGIWLENMNLNFAGDQTLTAALTVAAPITVSKSGCAIRGCLINMGIDADQIVTNGITTTAAGDDLWLENNTIVSATAAECTSMLKFVGADRLVMINNYIAGATGSAAAGVVLFATTASLDIYMQGNTIINRKALSQAAVTGLAGVSGVSRDDHYGYLDTASLTPWMTSTGIMTFHRPTVTNTAGEVGTEVVGTVSA